MKKIIIPTLFIALLQLSWPSLALTQTTAPRDPSEYFFDLTLGDFQEELETAREEGKKGIVFYFEMESCPFCHHMKNTVLNQPKVQNFFKENFLIFSVDIESDVKVTDFEGHVMTERDFAFKGNRVRATPAFVFYDLEGKQLEKYVGATSSAEEFQWLGEYVTEGIYKKMPFIRYKRQKKAAAKKQPIGT